MEMQSRLSLLLGFRQSREGMTEEIAKRSIDWLRDSGAGVLALMGGEPLLRPQFAHKVCYYAAKKGSGFMFRPTRASYAPK